jgi:hypothetical protein
MQQNEEEIVVELQFVNDTAWFHIPKRVQYTMQKIFRIEEWCIRYKMSSASNMEPWEAFLSRMMRQPNIWARLPLSIEPLEVKPEGWGDNAIRGYLYRSTTMCIRNNKDEFVNPKTW